MKALSVKQPWADLIISGKKTIEVRSWAAPKNHAGTVLICSSKKPIIPGAMSGYAIGLVDLVGCRPITMDDIPNTGFIDLVIDDDDYWQNARLLYFKHLMGAWAWLLKNPRPIEPFPVKGKLGFFDVEFQEKKHEIK